MKTTAGMENYVFPALVEHPFQHTIIGGLFRDLIADPALDDILCFDCNLPL